MTDQDTKLLKFECVYQVLTKNAKKWVLDLGEGGLASLLNHMSSAYGNTHSDNNHVTHSTAELVSASASIGLEGESEIESILQGRYRTVNMAKSGKCGDFIIVVNGVRILIEVKKYTTTVPSAEVDKFYRDIDANASIDSGLMISLTSRIVGINNVISMSNSVISGRSVPVMFACLGTVCDKKTSTETIYACIDLLTATVNAASLYVTVENDIALAVDRMAINIDLLSQCRTTIHETQSIVNKQYGRLMQNILEAELSIRASINAITSKIQKEEMVSGYNLSSFSTKSSNLIIPILDICKEMKKQIIVNKAMSVVATECKKMCIKINKTNIKITFELPPSSLMPALSKLPSTWCKFSMSGNKSTLELDETSLQTVLEITRMI